MSKFWAILSNKVFWTLLVSGLISLAQWLLGQAFWPSAQVGITIALQILTIIAGLIAGTVQANTTAKIKAQMAQLTLKK